MNSSILYLESGHQSSKRTNSSLAQSEVIAQKPVRLAKYNGSKGGSGALKKEANKYAVGSKSFRPDIQKPRQMENAVRDI